MKSFTSFFQLLAIVVFCFASNKSFAQINALGSALTSNQYTVSEIAGYGNNTVVVLKKPDVVNGYRLASYGVSTTGSIELKDFEDFILWGVPVITKLSPSRMAIVTGGSENSTARIYDIDGNGDLTPKATELIAFAAWGAQSIIRLSSSSFAVAYSVDGKIYIYTLAVNAAGTTLSIKDEDQYAVTSLHSIELARMSDTRIIAAARLSNNQMKAVCYDVNATTSAIARKGSYLWSNTIQKVSMTAFGNNKLACFSNDMNHRLDIITFEVGTAGTFTVKYQYSDLKMPGTNTFYNLKSLDSQYDSGVNKIHLCAVRTTNKLNVIPFTFTTGGSLTIEPSGHYLSTANYTATSASAAAGFVVTSSVQSYSKVRIQAFKWGN